PIGGPGGTSGGFGCVRGWSGRARERSMSSRRAWRCASSLASVTPRSASLAERRRSPSLASARTCGSASRLLARSIRWLAKRREEIEDPPRKLQERWLQRQEHRGDGVALPLRRHDVPHRLRNHRAVLLHRVGVVDAADRLRRRLELITMMQVKGHELLLERRE